MSEIISGNNHILHTMLELFHQCLCCDPNSTADRSVIWTKLWRQLFYSKPVIRLKKLPAGSVSHKLHQKRAADTRMRGPHNNSIPLRVKINLSHLPTALANKLRVQFASKKHFVNDKSSSVDRPLANDHENKNVFVQNLLCQPEKTIVVSSYFVDNDLQVAPANAINDEETTRTATDDVLNDLIQSTRSWEAIAYGNNLEASESFMNEMPVTSLHPNKLPVEHIPQFSSTIYTGHTLRKVSVPTQIATPKPRPEHYKGKTDGYRKEYGKELECETLGISNSESQLQSSVEGSRECRKYTTNNVFNSDCKMDLFASSSTPTSPQFPPIDNYHHESNKKARGMHSTMPQVSQASFCSSSLEQPPENNSVFYNYKVFGFLCFRFLDSTCSFANECKYSHILLPEIVIQKRIAQLSNADLVGALNWCMTKDTLINHYLKVFCSELGERHSLETLLRLVDRDSFYPHNAFLFIECVMDGIAIITKSPILALRKIIHHFKTANTEIVNALIELIFQIDVLQLQPELETLLKVPNGSPFN